LSILAVGWKSSVTERKLAVDKGFYSEIQDILQVEDMIFT